MLVTLLSCTSTSSGFKFCASMEARHWRSISPPLMSTTMTETSVMAHPVEVHRSGQAAQLHALLPVDLYRGDVVRVRRRRRQHERPHADLDRRPPLRGIAQMGRPL